MVYNGRTSETESWMAMLWMGVFVAKELEWRLEWNDPRNTPVCRWDRGQDEMRFHVMHVFSYQGDGSIHD